MADVTMRLVMRLLRRDEGDNQGNTMASSDSTDDFDDDYYDDDYGWWWSPTGMAVRYTIITVIFAAILLYFVGGYLHAIRRVRKGLPPKAYHAWMVRRYYHTPQHDPYYQHPPYGQDAYAMPAFQQPPPAYNPYNAPPPAYQPPPGASKIMADQNFPSAQTHRAGEHAEGSQSATVPAATVHQ